MRTTFSTFVTPTRDSDTRTVGADACMSGTWERGVGSIDPERTAASGTLLARPEKGAPDMPYTRAQVREAVERAGDDHWRALIRHHEDAYPASRPTPGDVCRAEAERLNGL